MLVDVPQTVAITCEQPAEVDFRDGLFYVFNPDLGVLRAYRPRTFYQCFAAAAAAIQLAQASPDGDILPFRREYHAGLPA
jgi:hypothetical protein